MSKHSVVQFEGRGDMTDAMNQLLQTGAKQLLAQAIEAKEVMGYSPARREAVLYKMLPPNQRSIPGLAREEGISEPILHAWRTKASNEGQLMPDSDNTLEGWSSRDKFNAVSRPPV